MLTVLAPIVLASPALAAHLSQLQVSHLPAERRQSLGWTVQESYAGRTFFDGFTFFNESDPNKGLVTYVAADTAFGSGLAFWSPQGIPGIQAEHWANLTVGTPRNSVRLSSKALFAGGLFIVDLALMPWGCGVWPAIWTLGYDGAWPGPGEIDIVEGIHEMSQNQYTLHSMPGCTLSPNSTTTYTGGKQSENCDSSAGGFGCTVVSNSAVSFGKSFNEAGGGVFAMLWDGTGIKFWNWERKAIPQDVTNGDPKPLEWGLPVAGFDASTCDPFKFFKAQQLILNINLCGDWAGGTYPAFTYCPGTCAERVANPANLVNTVMLFNSIKIYQQASVAPTSALLATTANAQGAAGPIAGVAGDPRGQSSPSDQSAVKSAAESIAPPLAAVLAAVGLHLW